MQGKQEFGCPKAGLWGQQAEMAAGAGAGQDREPSESSFGVLVIYFSSQEAALFQHCVRVDGLLFTKSTLKSRGGEAGRKMNPPRAEPRQPREGSSARREGGGEWRKQKRTETSFTAERNPRLPKQGPQPHLTSSLRVRADAVIPISPRTAPCAPHKLLFCFLPPRLPRPQLLPLLAPAPGTRRGEQPFPPFGTPARMCVPQFPHSPSRTLGKERFLKPLWEAFLRVFQQGRFPAQI